MDKEHDLALIHITSQSFPGFGKLPYAVKTSLADVGESVFVLGYPLTDTMGDEIKAHDGYHLIPLRLPRRSVALSDIRSYPAG